MRRLTLGVVVPLGVGVALVVAALGVAASSSGPGHSSVGPRQPNGTFVTGRQASSIRTLTSGANACDGAFDYVSSPNGTLNNFLVATSAVSPNDVWAVGFSAIGLNSYDKPLAEHWNGSGWSIVPVPDPTSFWADLNGVVAISSSDVWAVGDYRVDLANHIHAFAEHWNGSNWSLTTALPNPGQTIPLAVTAVASNNVWLAGTWLNPSNGIFSTLIEKWNGSSWSQVSSFSLTGNDDELFGISAFNSTDIWAVGESTFSTSTFSQSLAEHWDGANWNQVVTPNEGAGDSIDFVTTLEAGHAVGVGSGVTTSGNPEVGEAWDLLASGSSTNSIHTSGGVFTNTVLESVARSGSAVWAVGFQNGTARNSGPNTLVIPATWNATTHTLAWGSPGTSADPSTAVSPENTLYAVAAASPYSFMAVGYFTNSGGTAQTLTEQYCSPHFVVSAPASVAAGSPFSVTVTVQTGGGNTVTGYQGTVHFTSSDSAAVLPSDYTFVPGDLGTRTFTGVVLNTPCVAQTITSADMVNPLTAPGTATVARFFSGPCAAPAGTPAARGGTQSTPPSSGAGRTAPGQTTGPGTPGIRTPRLTVDLEAGVLASDIPSAATSSPANASSAQGTEKAVPTVHVPTTTNQQAGLLRDDAARPAAAHVSLATRNVAASPGPGQPPWAPFMLLVIPAVLVAGFRRRKSQERSHVKARP